MTDEDDLVVYLLNEYNLKCIAADNCTVILRIDNYYKTSKITFSEFRHLRVIHYLTTLARA